MIYEYSVQQTFDKAIDVVDIGNMCLCCTNDDGAEFYLLTRTVMGKVSIIKCGPIASDIPMLANGFTVEYKKLDYKEQAINKEVKIFINDFKKEIKEIVEITAEEFWQRFPDIEELYNTTD